MVFGKEELEEKIGFLYDKLEELKRDYRRENSRYLETKYLNIMSVLMDELSGVPQKIQSDYNSHIKNLRKIGQDIEILKEKNEERHKLNTKKDEKIEEDIIHKREILNNLDNRLNNHKESVRNKKVQNLKIRKTKIKGLKLGIVKLGLVVGGVILLKSGVNKMMESHNYNKQNQEYINDIIYSEDNFNNSEAIRYFEEQGINKKNIIKDKIHYHIVTEDDNKVAKDISKIYKEKIKITGIENVSIISVKEAQKKIDEWNNQKDLIKEMLERTPLNYEQIVETYLNRSDKAKDIDLDKENIFVYIRSSRDIRVSNSGVLFDELTKASLENNGLLVGDTKEMLSKNLNNLDEALEYISESNTYQSNSGEKYMKYVDVPGVDVNFIDLGVSNNLSDEEKEKIASSLLEATVMYNLKGSKVEQEKIPQIITDYDKVKFQIESKRR